VWEHWLWKIWNEIRVQKVHSITAMASCLDFLFENTKNIIQLHLMDVCLKLSQGHKVWLCLGESPYKNAVYLFTLLILFVEKKYSTSKKLVHVFPMSLCLDRRFDRIEKT
jgi:hypothetical protein